MATATLTPEQTVSQTLIDELEVIAAQNEAGKGQTSEDRQAKRSLSAMSEKLDSLTDRLVEAGADAKVIDDISQQLADYAELILPTAEITWDRETVNSKLGILSGFTVLGYLSDDQKDAVVSIRERLSIRRGGSGERAARTEQEAIEGRPAFVTITDEEGNTFSTQKGNVPTSAANIKTRAVAYLKAAAGADVPDEVGKAILETVKSVVEDGLKSATFSGLTFAAAEAK